MKHAVDYHRCKNNFYWFLGNDDAVIIIAVVVVVTFVFILALGGFLYKLRYKKSCAM